MINQQKDQMNKDIELRSDEVREIMGKIPHWIIRNGIVVILITILIVIAGSFFFKYPDLIRGNIIITSENPPANLVAKTSGKISNLLVNDNQEIRKGDYLAVIENPANYQDMQVLKLKLDSFSLLFKTPSSIHINSIQFNNTYNLGECQGNFADFMKKLGDYKSFADLNYYPKKITSLNEEISMHNQYISRLENQKAILKEKLDLSYKDFERDSILYTKDIIPQADFDKRKSEFLKNKYDFETALTAITDKKIRIKQLEQEKLDLKLRDDESIEEQELILKEFFDKLIGAFDIWEQTYIIKSPIKGTVTFNKIWSENQNIQAGENVMSIVPRDEEEIIGKLQLPLERSGKVKAGHQVNIKFSNYPHMEYGIVRGEVSNISLVPENNFYMVKVDFPEGLLTNYGKSLVFIQEMQGTAEIITDDMRLIERIINPIKSIIKKNKM